MGLKSEQLERFRTIVTGINGDLVIVIAQVDPDAIASALGLAAIIEKIQPGLTGRIKIVYCGRTSHPQNRGIINSLDLGKTLLPISDFRFQSACPEHLILVDSSAMDDGRLPEQFRQCLPMMIIDHHQAKLPEVKENQFFWVETNGVGACSTLIVELGLALELSFDHRENLLLACGIHSDTGQLVDGHRRDRDAFGHVTKELTGKQFSQLIKYTLPVSFYRNFAYALEHHEKLDSRLIANVGRVNIDDADDISTIAEELVRMEGITLAIVFGIVGKQVRVSARSTNPSLDLGNMLREYFGQDKAGAKLTPDGRGVGGALVELDLGMWASDGVREQLEALVFARIKEMVFEADEK